MATTTEPAVEHVREEVEKQIRKEYEARFAKEMAEFQDRYRVENDAALQKVIEEFRAEQKPPTQEEIATMLKQEYLTFEVSVPWEYPEPSQEKTRTFMIQELPQSVEKQFYKNFEQQLVPLASDLGALTFDMVEGDVAEKIKSLLKTLDPAFDLMADAVVMILNPRGKMDTITRSWVQSNLSSYRQWNIIMAQVQVNRLRDFFSQISRGSRKMTTTLGVSTRR